MARSIDARKWREWRQRMQRFEERQQSVAAFCYDEGVSEASFYHWRRRLLAEPSVPERGSDADATTDFKPVRLLAATSIAVRLPGGTRLRVPSSDPQAVRLVIETVARLDAEHAGGGPC